MKISHSDLVELLVDKMVEQMTHEDFVQFFCETQIDYFDNSATADEMVATAVHLGIIGPDESIEFID